MKLINKYFPTLTSEQRERFEALDALYHDWNAKINVISRKDIDNLYEHHVLHSLGIAHIIRWPSSSPTASFISSTASRKRCSYAPR